MRLFIYILLFAVIAMFYKTFYLDYKKKEVPAETNVSVEAVQPVVQEPIPQEPVPVKTAAPKKRDKADENRTGWQSRKGMPIDQLGDTIGESLKDKINIK